MLIANKPLALWRRSCLAGLLLLLAQQSAQANPATEISFGIEPLLSARTLATAFQGVRDFVGSRSGSKVVVGTAVNYDQFVQQLLGGEFDLAFIGPHSSLLASQKAGYLPLFKCEGAMKAVLIVDRNSAYQKPQDLKGQIVALPDHLTLGAMLGTEFFRPPQLPAPVDVSFKYNDYSNSAALMLLRGDAAAAVVILQTLRVMSPEIQKSVRILTESKPVPHMVIVVHPRVTPEKRVRLRDALVEFTRVTDPRRNIFVQSCKPGDQLLSEQETRQLQPYVEELRRRLGQ